MTGQDQGEGLVRVSGGTLPPSGLLVILRAGP